MLSYSFVSYYLGLMLLGFAMVGGWWGGSLYLTGASFFLEWEVLSFFGESIIMVVIFDWMSMLFSGVVMFISSMVLFYSSYYMEGDRYFYRFIVLVYLFVCSMLLMILSPNIISILLGWDGLGLVSYCLVIYYQGVKSANAGMLTILSNRVGDVALLLSIAWLFNFGSWSFSYFHYFLSLGDVGFIMIMVIMAAMTKSAQIPFSAWLPAAMAAPTPVSALVHSSTLVTAGVYLLIRFNYLIGVNSFILWVGAVTMFMSGLGANFEMDLKKIIALSTLSQLGVMVFVLGLGVSELAFFHLLTHALFKSLLFLCAGGFIHSMGDAQDVRYLGGLSKLLPLGAVFFASCSLSLCGFPFLSGFYSKDLILELSLMGGAGQVLCLVVVLGVFFTVTYSTRLGCYLFTRNLGVRASSSYGEMGGMSAPMGGLYTVSVFAGGLMAWFMFPSYGVLLGGVLKVLFSVATVGLIVLIYFNVTGGEVGSASLTFCLLRFVGGMWLMPNLSTSLFMGVLGAGRLVIKYFDQGWVEFLGGQGGLSTSSSVGVKVDYGSAFSLKMYLCSFFLILLFLVIYC